MPTSQPHDLVLGLQQRDSIARGQLEECFRGKVTRLIDELGDRLGPNEKRKALVEYALRAIELWLMSSPSATFSSDSWNTFRARVMLYCWRLFQLPCPDQQVISVEPQHDKDWTGPFSIHGFLRQQDEVGGDVWQYDCGDELFVLVADVTSHGWPAHLLATGLPKLWQMCLARVSVADRRPSRLLAEMDRELAGRLPDGTFVEATVAQFVGLPNPLARLCAAGHAAVVLRSATGRFEKIGGMWLGLFAGTARTDTELPFGRDEELLLATDGLWEQPLDSAVESRLASTINDFLKQLQPTDPLHDAMVTRFESVVKQFGRQNDDVCIVTIRHSGLPGPTTSESELVGRILRHRDGLAESELVSRFTRLIWSLTRRILHHRPAHWDDAYQEVWLRIWHKLADWRGGRLASWIGRTSVNRLIDYSKRTRSELTTTDLNNDIQDRLRDSLVGSNHSACVDCAKAVLATHSAIERRLIEMVAEGIPHAQIREQLGFKQKTFYNRIAEIRHEIEARCHEHCYDH